MKINFYNQTNLAIKPYTKNIKKALKKKQKRKKHWKGFLIFVNDEQIKLN